MSNAEAAGQTIGASAASATPTPPADPNSLDSGWVDTTGCPSGILAGFLRGVGTGSTGHSTTPSTSSGPTELPNLTSPLVPSCAFVFTDPHGNQGNGEIFIGMGQAYVDRFTTAVLAAGFVLKATIGYDKTYINGSKGIELGYIPEGTDGSPYSIVAVVGLHA